MLAPQTSQRLLYTAAGLSAFAVYKHTSLVISEYFPQLDSRLGPKHPATVAAKSQMLQLSSAIAVIGILQLKWAQFGISNPYEKVLLGVYGVSSFGFGLQYFIQGVYVPLVPLWLTPALTWLSQL